MDKSAGEPVRWDWAFEGGEPSVSNLFSPEIVYNYPGTYTVKLRVGRGTENAETEMLKYITVVYPDEITVAFKANKTQALSDESISFTDMSVGFPSTWLWEFIPAEGRTVTSTEQNPSLVFEPGVYSVKLTVTNPKTTATLTQENYLNIIDKGSDQRAVQYKTKMLYRCKMSYFMDSTIVAIENYGPHSNGTSPIAFTYGDYSKNSPYDPSYYYVSEGMQEPLKYVGDRAKVKMIVPFKRGAYNDQSNGHPVYYEILEYIFEENL